MSITKLLENKNKLGHSTFLGYRGKTKPWYHDEDDDNKPKYAYDASDSDFISALSCAKIGSALIKSRKIAETFPNNKSQMMNPEEEDAMRVKMGEVSMHNKETSLSQKCHHRSDRIHNDIYPPLAETKP